MKMMMMISAAEFLINTVWP